MKFWKVCAAFLMLKTFGLVCSEKVTGLIAVGRKGCILSCSNAPYVVTARKRKGWKGYCAIEPAGGKAQFKKEWGFYNVKTGRIAVGFSIEHVLLSDKIRKLQRRVALLEKRIKKSNPTALALVGAQEQAFQEK